MGVSHMNTVEQCGPGTAVLGRDHFSDSHQGSSPKDEGPTPTAIPWRAGT